MRIIKTHPGRETSKCSEVLFNDVSVFAKVSGLCIADINTQKDHVIMDNEFYHDYMKSHCSIGCDTLDNLLDRLYVNASEAGLYGITAIVVKLHAFRGDESHKTWVKEFVIPLKNVMERSYGEYVGFLRETMMDHYYIKDRVAEIRQHNPVSPTIDDAPAEIPPDTVVEETLQEKVRKAQIEALTAHIAKHRTRGIPDLSFMPLTMASPKELMDYLDEAGKHFRSEEARREEHKREIYDFMMASVAELEKLGCIGRNPLRVGVIKAANILVGLDEDEEPMGSGCGEVYIEGGEPKAESVIAAMQPDFWFGLYCGTSTPEQAARRFVEQATQFLNKEQLEECKPDANSIIKELKGITPTYDPRATRSEIGLGLVYVGREVDMTPGHKAPNEEKLDGYVSHLKAVPVETLPKYTHNPLTERLFVEGLLSSGLTASTGLIGVSLKYRAKEEEEPKESYYMASPFTVDTPSGGKTVYVESTGVSNFYPVLAGKAHLKDSIKIQASTAAKGDFIEVMIAGRKLPWPSYLNTKILGQRFRVYWTNDRVGISVDVIVAGVHEALVKAGLNTNTHAILYRSKDKPRQEISVFVHGVFQGKRLVPTT